MSEYALKLFVESRLQIFCGFLFERANVLNFILWKLSSIESKFSGYENVIIDRVNLDVA